MNAPQVRDIENDHRVAALAKVTQMHDDLINANVIISKLRADLTRANDRVALIFEERDRYRHESLKLRKLLVEMTTQIANIGLLTRRAEEYVATVSEMDAAPTPATAEIDKLETEYNKQEQPT